MPGGRPKIEIDWDSLEALLGLEASEYYCATWLLKKQKKEINKKSVDAAIKVIQRRITERFGMSFVQYRDKMLDGRRMKLRELQWKAADKGNAAILIWLGKQYLGQVDQHKVETGDKGLQVVMNYERNKKMA
jgi:hypothetical protein